MKAFSYLDKKWGFIIHYTISFLIGGNLFMVLFYLYLGDWIITEDITSKYQGRGLLTNVIVFSIGGFLLALRAWKKKNGINNSDL